MKARSFLAVLAVVLVSTTAGGDPQERVNLADNLDRLWFGSDRLTDLDWDAQTFNSGECRRLRRVVLNLYQRTRPAVAATGNFWVKLYDSSGPNGSPGPGPVAVLAEPRPIADLPSDTGHQVVLAGLSVPLEPGTRYFVVVGCDSGALGLAWGFTQDSVGALGFPSIFTFSADAGVSWQVPFMNALPQRMKVVGDPDAD